MSVQQRVNLLLSDSDLTLLKKEVVSESKHQTELADLIEAEFTENKNISTKRIALVNRLRESAEYLQTLANTL